MDNISVTLEDIYQRLNLIDKVLEQQLNAFKILSKHLLDLQTKVNGLSSESTKPDNIEL